MSNPLVHPALMNQTLIKALVAASALAALAVVVYRAQHDVPAPQSSPASAPLTHDPVLPPAVKTDVALGLQPLGHGRSEGVEPAGAAAEPAATPTPAEPAAAEPAATPSPAVVLEPPEMLFLPSTHAPAPAPVNPPDGQDLETE